MNRDYPDEWTQEEFLKAKQELAKEGIKVLLIDTILSPIERADTVVYNPAELAKEPPSTIFVFYCDTGKATMDRLQEYKQKFPHNPCISLKGGRGYWRKYMEISDE